MRSNILKECVHCGSNFFTTTQRKHVKFCSRKCYSSSRPKKILVICSYCGVGVYKQPSHISTSIGFCSIKCSNRSRAKEGACLNCRKTIIGISKKYCSPECRKGHEKKDIIEKIENGSYKTKGSMTTLRKYLFETRGKKCEYCLLESWMGKPIPLEVEHVDGNSSNNSLENIKLICPNCHALTPTYKARNKGNGRHYRMQRYYEGLSY